MIPANLIERVETITDGGSAQYGSDAIGGVINFITKKKFDGLQIDGKYGAADSYKQHDISVTMGSDWGRGSAFIGYTNSHHGGFSGLDRDFIKGIDWTTGIPVGRQCDVSNITRSGFPAGTDFLGTNPTVSAPVAACDMTDYQTLVPDTHRHNVLAGINQKLSDSLELDIRGYYSDRSDAVTIGALRSATSSAVANLRIPVTNFYRQQLGGFGTETQQANSMTCVAAKSSRRSVAIVSALTSAMFSCGLLVANCDVTSLQATAPADTTMVAATSR